MPSEMIDMPAVNEARRFIPLQDMMLRSFEKMKLQHRAEKYLYKEDSGGIAYIRRTVKKGAIVFDIGAHKAGYLYFFLAQLGNTGCILAFEPQAILYRYLLKMKQLFSWQNVIVESFAVSNQTGTALLSIPYNNGRPSSPCATIIESRVPFTYQSRAQVNTISIDTYCRQHTIIPDFLKVDVEGNELLVFIGAKETLQAHKPKILFECETRFVGEKKLFETFQFLQDIGYCGYFIIGGDIRPISEFNTVHHQNLLAGPYCNNFIFE